MKEFPSQRVSVRRPVLIVAFQRRRDEHPYELQYPVAHIGEVSPSIEAVAIKSPVTSIEMSLTEAVCAVKDLMCCPERSRMCSIPPCVPRA